MMLETRVVVETLGVGRSSFLNLFIPMALTDKTFLHGFQGSMRFVLSLDLLDYLCISSDSPNSDVSLTIF